MKVCTKCKEIKQLSEFHRDRNTKDGLSYPCKICCIAKSTEYALKNKEKVANFICTPRSVCAEDKGKQARIDKAVLDLKGANPETRDDAVKTLDKLKAMDHAKDIAGVLLDKDSLVQFDAVEALVKFDARDQTKAVAELLKDDDNFVRGAAIVALGEFHAKEYAKDIVSYLKDKDSAMRRSAVEALATLGAKEYSKEIAGFLNDEDSDMRGRVIYALGKLGAKDYADEIIKKLADQDSCYSYDELNKKFIVTTVSAEAQRVLRSWKYDVDKLKSAAGK